MFPTIRLVACLLELLLPLVLWRWLQPDRRQTAAALLASGWALPAATLGGAASAYFGIAKFPPPLVFGAPPDILLARVLMGGFVCNLCFPSVAIRRLYVFALASDLAYSGLAGGAFAIRCLPANALIVAFYFIPAHLFARWTRESRDLPARAALHVVFHAGLLLGVLPALIVLSGGGNWSAPLTRNSFMNKLYLQLLIVPAVLLISSVQEFARRGCGTPMPADPPQRLVTSGTYAYVANPMQLGKFLAVAGWGLFWWNGWMVAAAVLGLLYSLWVASPREDAEMAQRFSLEWSRYHRQVRRWLPRWRRYEHSLTQPLDEFPQAAHEFARLYLRLECEPCNQLAEWIRPRAMGLQVLAIERSGMARMTYDPGHGGPQEYGVLALGRAIEHINLAWAFFGWMLRLPGIGWFTQLVADALDPQSGAHGGETTGDACKLMA